MHGKTTECWQRAGKEDWEGVRDLRPHYFDGRQTPEGRQIGFREVRSSAMNDFCVDLSLVSA